MKKSFPFSTKIFCFLAIFCFYFQGAQALNWSENQTMKVDSSGNIVAVWQSYDQINEVYVIQSSYYDTTSATWSSVSTISDTTINSFSPVVASNSAGDVVVTWVTDNSNGTPAIWASVRPVNGSFSSPAALSDINDIAIIQACKVSVNNSGNIIVSWLAFIDFTYTAVVRAVQGTITGSWSAPVTVSN